MIDARIREIIENNTIGFVASITAEGRPTVSPKATFAVIDDRTLAFSNLRSPKTVRNIQHNPAVEVNFIDVFHRTAARITGAARYVPKKVDAEFETLLPAFEKWSTLVDRMHGFVVISVDHAEFVTSPSYDIGATGDELAATWLEHFTGLFSKDMQV
ncbi:MAG: pyridoxamine 5'-phosphate oxidase family protein [Chloroflexi bacterium]|nr:pyridoxamine 5'-phosphate oxidase family protein [Chloroflexota bacterium]MDA1226700.1 pyridoxamine 5'-phosphate oxidase family protein [Chloroflexota bacterium]